MLGTFKHLAVMVLGRLMWNGMPFGELHCTVICVKHVISGAEFLEVRVQYMCLLLEVCTHSTNHGGICPGSTVLVGTGLV